MFESRTERSWIRRYARMELPGNSGRVLDLTEGTTRTSDGTVLDRPGRLNDISAIIAATVSGTAQTVGNLIVEGHRIYHTATSWLRGSTSNPLNISIEYEYGVQGDWEAHQRGLQLLLANATPSTEPDRATSFSNPDGTFRLATFPVDVENFFERKSGRIPVG